MPSVLASVESLQIVSFQWDAVHKKLVPFAYGSGTALQKNVVLTNKHVVMNAQTGRTADFLLLCPAQHKSTRGVVCHIPGGVVSVHEKFDAALVKPLASDVFLPYVRTAYYRKGIGDSIRLEGFPLPLDLFQNFGSSETRDSIINWITHGGTLLGGGDKLTITRGKVTLEGVLKTTGGHYLFTDAKVHFGNSGGAAFDAFGNYIGIPTLKDKDSHAIILTYSQLRPWLASVYKKYPKVDQEILDYYETISGEVKPSRRRGVSRSVPSSVLVKNASRRIRSMVSRNYFRGRTRVRPSVKTTKSEATSSVKRRYRPFSGGYYRRRNNY